MLPLRHGPQRIDQVLSPEHSFDQTRLSKFSADRSEHRIRASQLLWSGLPTRLLQFNFVYFGPLFASLFRLASSISYPVSMFDPLVARQPAKISADFSVVIVTALQRR